MIEIRPLSGQFEANEFARIQILIQRAKDFRLCVSSNASAYYFYELAKTLNAGLLLASLSLAITTFELVVREQASLGNDLPTVPKPILDAPFSSQEDLEMNKSIKFEHLIDSQNRLRDKEINEKAKFLYERVRTPLSHGLVSRLLYGERSKNETLPYIFGPELGLKDVIVSVDEMEDFVELQAINILEEIFEVFSVCYAPEKSQNCKTI